MKFELWNKENWKRELVLVGVLLLLCYALWYVVDQYNKSVDALDQLVNVYVITNQIKRCDGQKFFTDGKGFYCQMLDGTIFGGPLKPTYYTFNQYVNAMAAISLADEMRQEGKLNRTHFDIFLRHVLETVYDEPENANLIKPPEPTSPSH